MRLKKRILGMGLAMSLMLSGLYVAPERVKAETGNEALQKVESVFTETVIAAKSSGKKVKMPEKAVDGSRIIVTSSIADSDGEYIYYTIPNLVTKDMVFPMLKRNIKTGKETLIGNGFDSIKLYKDYLFCTPYIDAIPEGDIYIYKVSKNGKKEKFVKGFGMVAIGNTIYCRSYKSKRGMEFEGSGIYKMDLKGKNKKLVKKDVLGKLGFSGKNIYYYNRAYDTGKVECFNLNTGKPENNVILSYLYDPASKTKVTYNTKEVKVGKYENGKWKYKTVFKGNENVEDACVCGGKILIKANYYDEAKGNGFIKFYIMDLNGKNKKLLHEGEAVG